MNGMANTLLRVGNHREEQEGCKSGDSTVQGPSVTIANILPTQPQRAGSQGNLDPSNLKRRLELFRREAFPIARTGH